MELRPFFTGTAEFETFLQQPGRKPAFHTLPFGSASYRILPDREECHPSIESEDSAVTQVSDNAIRENRSFAYSVLHRPSEGKAKKVILLLHGLNEKSWDKYLSWAYALWERTGKAVVLFPLAFHMNRAPSAWSDRKRMMPLSRRRSEVSGVTESSFLNAALSERLQENPRRFIWSGIESYYDVLQLVEEIRSGRHTLIAGEAEIDFFGYSIGAFLTEILMMRNPDDLFSDSRAFLFCGGATLDRISPLSRYILDSGATDALMRYMKSELLGELNQTTRLTRFLRRTRVLGEYLLGMVNADLFRGLRDQAFRNLAGRIRALGLMKDTVVPGEEIGKTLSGDGSAVSILDFPYDYSHENPFPRLRSFSAEVERGFDEVFSRAAAFLGPNLD